MSKLWLLSKLPLSIAASNLLDSALNSAGLRRQDVTLIAGAEYEDYRRDDAATGHQTAGCQPGRPVPNLLVTLGHQAAYDFVPGWPESFGAIQDRRGYLWQDAAGRKVLTTLWPEECLVNSDPSGIKGMLLQADLERARKESISAILSRPSRTISVVSGSTAEGQHMAESIRSAGYAACDIECSDPQTLLCIGFAVSPTEAYVFVGEALAVALEIVADPSVRKIFQNGAFDAYFLKTRCGVTVAGYDDDCMIAWHALWPEIAGKSEKKSAKRTRKSLAFLISLYCASPEWHKDYDTDEAGMYQLCGIDVCTTYEIMEKQKLEVAEAGVEATYRHEMSMQPVLVAIQERGLLIHENLRLEAIAALRERSQAAEDRIRELAEPLLRERRSQLTKPHLFFSQKRCACCNGGKSKRMACWSCAGLDKAPGKAEVRARLQPCTACGGVGGAEEFTFNPGSKPQQVELFYNVLKLPERFNEGSLTVDEKALKSLMATL